MGLFQKLRKGRRLLMMVGFYFEFACNKFENKIPPSSATSCLFVTSGKVPSSLA
jgi:hypothetical protein